MLIVAGLLLIAGSTLDRWTVVLGDANIYVSQLLALVLVPTAFAVRPNLNVVRTASLVLLLLAIALLLPAVLTMPESSTRLRILFQVTINIVSFVVAFSVFDALTDIGFRRLLVYLTTLAVGSVLLERVLSTRSDDRFFGIQRPTLLFYEPTWFAIAAAIVLAVALAMRMTVPALLLGGIVVVIFTRSALVMAVASLLMCVPVLRRSVFVRALVILVISIASMWLVWSALFGPPPSSAHSSLDTRALDIWVIRTANNDSFLPWGGEVLSARIDGFWRETRGGSNVAIMEYLWKFGIGGIAYLIAWIAVIVVAIPRRIFAVDSTARVWIIWIALATIPAVVQINNAMGQPWLWILCALALSAGTRLGGGSNDGLGSRPSVRHGS